MFTPTGASSAITANRRQSGEASSLRQSSVSQSSYTDSDSGLGDDASYASESRSSQDDDELEYLLDMSDWDLIRKGAKAVEYQAGQPIVVEVRSL